MYRLLSILLLATMSCDTGNLTVVADLPKALNEVSGIETVSNSDLIWMLNDSGNASTLYGLNITGKIEKEININVKNNDWEDLASDTKGNLYIGDFGNNAKKRKQFSIIKINVLEEQSPQSVIPEIISFKLPENMSPKDFEAFFLFQNHFYVFSKESKKFKVLKIPNKTGEHIAEIVSEYNFKEKKSLITAADISDDGKTIMLLNHNKVWVLRNFKNDDFFSGNIEKLSFEHSSQKESICFKNNTEVYIADEKTKHGGGNLYSFILN